MNDVGLNCYFSYISKERILKNEFSYVKIKNDYLTDYFDWRLIR